jgi:pimeloyl-ACP methyl ester carboxylesterase
MPDGHVPVIERASLLAALAVLAIASRDAPLVPLSESRPGPTAPATACEGARDALPDALFYELRGGAFPDSSRPDVAVHVPPGFDATRRPGLLVYFHGWLGCVAAALSTDDESCTDAGPPRPGADLASAVDAAGVNALLVAVELRSDMPTGEPGKLAMPGGLRDLLRELFSEHLADPLGCVLDVDALDRVVLVAHSGGYQAAASALALGDVARVTEVDLLDALYGADDVFSRWIEAQALRFDPRVSDPLRFVDLYTCCGGTTEPSRALARRASSELSRAGLAGALSDDDLEAPVASRALAHGVVFKRVPGPHGDLPRAYFRELVQSAGFAHIQSYPSHSPRPK